MEPYMDANIIIVSEYLGEVTAIGGGISNLKEELGLPPEPDKRPPFDSINSHANDDFSDISFFDSGMQSGEGPSRGRVGVAEKTTLWDVTSPIDQETTENVSEGFSMGVNTRWNGETVDDPLLKSERTLTRDMDENIFLDEATSPTEAQGGGTETTELLSIGSINSPVIEDSNERNDNSFWENASTSNQMSEAAVSSINRGFVERPSFLRSTGPSMRTVRNENLSLGGTSSSSPATEDKSETPSFLRNTTYPINGDLDEKLSYIKIVTSTTNRMRSETPSFLEGSASSFSSEGTSSSGVIASPPGEDLSGMTLRHEGAGTSGNGNIGRNTFSEDDFMGSVSQNPARNSSYKKGSSTIGGNLVKDNLYISNGTSPVNENWSQNPSSAIIIVSMNNEPNFLSEDRHSSRKREPSLTRRNLSPVMGNRSQENAYLSLRTSPIRRIRDKNLSSARSILTLRNDPGSPKEELVFPLSGRTRREMSKGSARPERHASLKAAEDVKQRIQDGNQIQEEYFTVGYRDPFSGVVEKPFTSIDWEQLDISRNRIQYFKYKGIKVWDIDKGLDHVFGSDGNNVQIQDKIDEIEEELETKALEFHPDDSDEDDLIMSGSSSVMSKTLDYGASGTSKPEVPRATHFLCIRVKNEQLKSMVARVQEHIIRDDSALRSCAMPSELLHVTLTRVQCMTSESILEVNNILKVMRPRIQDLVGSSEESNPQRTIKARGLATFGGRVLYARLDVPASFTAVVEAIHEAMGNIRNVIVTSHFEFVPHMTLIKLNHRAGRVRGFIQLDSSLYNDYLDQDFGTIAFDNIHFCPIYDIKGPDGFYVTSKKIQF